MSNYLVFIENFRYFNRFCLNLIDIVTPKPLIFLLVFYLNLKPLILNYLFRTLASHTYVRIRKKIIRHFVRFCPGLMDIVTPKPSSSFFIRQFFIIVFYTSIF